MMIRSKFVMPLPFAEGAATSGAVAPMVRAYNALRDAASASDAKARALAKDRHYTPEGRRAQLAYWLRSEGMNALRESRAALVAADKAMGELKAKMARPALDKTDVAGALLRQETRAWLRSQDPMKVAALLRREGLTGERIDPVIVDAILEAPPELSGLSAKQRDRLEAAQIAMLHPEAAAEAAQIESMMQVLASADRAALELIGEDTLTGASALEEMLSGGETLSEKVRESLRRGGVFPAEEAEPLSPEIEHEEAA